MVGGTGVGFCDEVAPSAVALRRLDRPFGVKRSSGSAVRFPTMVVIVSFAMVIVLSCWGWLLLHRWCR